MQMTKILCLSIFIGVIGSAVWASVVPTGKKYALIKAVYLMGVYDSRNNKTISQSTAKAYLHSERYADKSIIAFQAEVPVGTVITVVRPTPKPWYMYFYADSYFVKLEPDLSQGLDVIMQIDRGLDGNLDGLNPEIFTRM